MPDIRLQATLRPATNPDRVSYLREESIYELLDRDPAFACPLYPILPP